MTTRLCTRACMSALLVASACSRTCGPSAEQERSDPTSPPPAAVHDQARLAGIVQIDAEHRLACALDDRGRIYCWGQFDFEPNFAALDRHFSRPILLQGVDRARSFALHPTWANFWVGYVVESTGEVKAWGNHVGPLYRVDWRGDPPARHVEPYDPALDPKLAEQQYPDQVLADPDWTAESNRLLPTSRLQLRYTRRAVTTRIKTSRAIVASGVCPEETLDDAVQLGDDHCAFLTDEPTWTRIQAGEPDLQLSGCARVGGGAVRCWMQCQRGEPGAFETQTRSFPLALLEPALDVVSPSFAECWAALLESGKIATWCQRIWSDEREPDTGYRCPRWGAPVLEPDVDGIFAIDDGGGKGFDVCGLRRDGEVVCLDPLAYPYESKEELLSRRRTYSGLDEPVAVAAGFGFACVLTGKGNVQCMGANDYGQCGTGATVLGYDRPSERIERPSFVVAPATDHESNPSHGGR